MTRGKIGLSFKGSAADALKFTNYTPHPRQRWLLEAKRKKIRKEEDGDLRMSQRDNGGKDKRGRMSPLFLNTSSLHTLH